MSDVHDSKTSDLDPVTAVSSDTRSGEVVDISESDNRNGEENLGKYRRTFLSRHIQIVTLGSNIGSGIFISTGKALRNGGPGNMIIGYTLVMTMVGLFQLLQRIDG